MPNKIQPVEAGFYAAKIKKFPKLRLRRRVTTGTRIRTFEHEERDFGRSALRRTAYARDLDLVVSYRNFAALGSGTFEVYPGFETKIKGKQSHLITKNS